MLGRVANCDPTQFKVGSRVYHYSDSQTFGTITAIDENLIEQGFSSTTCEVVWDYDGSKTPDILWTNKLFLTEGNIA